ncbi:hypothetical protein BDN72DRAFT_298078 [Pluteus cervinus]|uniref:Uncharacterized protein n=1 Tax=Pluteus cervinus TaxID=181527 RepID=A0ACD3AGF0_9AGAR|nr:hypothetical protein BDN72DRAFT_298078 [Pluteus cervinus]
MKANLSFFLARDLGARKLKELLGDAFESDAPAQSEGSDGLHGVYASNLSNLAFHGVEDCDGMSAIPCIFGIEERKRDATYDFLVPTDKNIIRIYLMQQTRIVMSRRPKSKIKDLSRVYNLLPIEIFFEIFSHLQALDLYNLCLAGRLFYSSLTGSQASERTWRNAYRQVDHVHWIPPPPPQVSGFHWAHLLFGPPSCSVSAPGLPRCNRLGAVIDFVQRHRVCRDCWLKCYITKCEDPDYQHDHPVWTLVPASRRRLGGGLHHLHYTDYRYYQPQVQKRLLTKRVEITEETVVPSQHLDSLKAEAREREYFAEECRVWSEGIIQRVKEHLHNRTWDVKRRSVRKLIKLGFTALEAESATWVLVRMQHRREITLHRLTPGVWRKIGPLLVKTIQDIRVNKPRNELAQSITKEIKLVDNFLDLYLGAYPLSTQDVLPTTKHLMVSEPIYSAMIEAVSRRMKSKNSEAEPGEGYEKYHDQLSTLIHHWQDDRRSHYANKIPHSWAGSSLSNSGDDIFALATSVFECLDCPTENGKKDPWQAGRALIGWKALNGHFSCTYRDWEDKLEFSEKGAEAARSLAILAGLEARAPLSSDLDSLDYRFTCENCPIARNRHRGYRGHGVWTWRQCVYHFIQMNRVKAAKHLTPRWNRLSPEIAAYFKRREIPVDVLDPAWCCLHCHRGSELTKRYIIQHVISSHQIQIPKADVDYKHTMRAQSSPPRDIGLSEHPTPTQYCCLRCEKPQRRLYAHRAIIPHLLDKHGISDVGEGGDYACIPLYDGHYT